MIEVPIGSRNSASRTLPKVQDLFQEGRAIKNEASVFCKFDL